MRPVRITLNAYSYGAMEQTMPDWNAALINPDINRYEAVSIGWMLVSGARFSTRISALGAGVSPDPGNVAAFREAAGDVSNAAVVRMTEERTTFTADINATVFDEAYSDGAVLVVYMQNNDGEVLTFEIPNPDVSVFESDGVTLDLTNTQAAALATAAATLVNNSFDPANSFAVTRGLLRSRSMKYGRGARVRPAVAEPGAGDLPPA